MTVIEVQTQKEYKQVPAGSHMARIVRVIDLGVQVTPFKDKNGDIKTPRQLTICFEIPSQKTDDGKPMLMYTKNLTYSLGFTDYKTKLREYSEAILGESVTKIDLSKLLDRTAMIQVVHVPSLKDPTRKYAQITGIMQIPDGITVPPAIHPLLYFSTTEFTKAIFDQLEEWLQKKIALPAGVDMGDSANDEQKSTAELLA